MLLCTLWAYSVNCDSCRNLISLLWSLQIKLQRCHGILCCHNYPPVPLLCGHFAPAENYFWFPKCLSLTSQGKVLFMSNISGSSFYNEWISIVLKKYWGQVKQQRKKCRTKKNQCKTELILPYHCESSSD